jgi:hypothetical protein
MMREAIGFIGFAVFAAVGLAQSAPVEPEFADIFYRLTDGNLVALERQAAAFKGSAHGFVVMGVKSAALLPGGKSPIRFKSGEQVDLVVRSMVSASTADPNTVYVLRKLSSKKKTRELVMTSGHFSPIGGSMTAVPAEGVLPVDFSRYGAASLKMSTGPLPPGEYAVGHPYGPAVFCFGVD